MQEQNLQSSSSSKTETGQNFGNGVDKQGGDNTTAGAVASALDTAKSTSMDLLQKAKSTAGEAYGSVTEKATSKLEEGKVGLSGGLTSVAESMRKVAGDINESAETSTIGDYSARYAETAAKRLEQAATYFENQDLAGITRDVESYARRNTAIFLGAAFALGILAARFIKSSPSTGEPRALSTGGRKSAGTASSDGIKGIESEGKSSKASASDTDRTGLGDPGLVSSARGV